MLSLGAVFCDLMPFPFLSFIIAKKMLNFNISCLVTMLLFLLLSLLLCNLLPSHTFFDQSDIYCCTCVLLRERKMLTFLMLTFWYILKFYKKNHGKIYKKKLSLKCYIFSFYFFLNIDGKCRSGNIFSSHVTRKNLQIKTFINFLNANLLKKYRGNKKV